MPIVIDVSHLKKVYGTIVAVEDISFQVEQGEIFGLLGPNGAGKTTAVECLQGLRQQDAGTVRVLGLDPQKETKTLRRKIGSQLQESSLPDRIKVGEALDLFDSFTLGGKDWHVLMQEWGLKEKSNTYFHDLSGGQRQRLLVALALINNPEMVFLDEMTTGLDPAARRMAWELIRDIRKRGATVILVTHFMEEAEALCDRLAIIDRGKVVAMDSPQGLINAYAKVIRIIFSTDVANISWLETIPYVQKVARNGRRVEIESQGPVMPLVVAALVNHGITPADLRIEQPSLEDVFLTITGSHIQG